MGEVRLGILPWGQATDWESIESVGRRVEELGYEHLWAWDHLHAIFGDPDQPIFEGWMTLAGWAGVTRRVRLGLLVGANTFRNPGVVAKMVTTLDHVSRGRAILGLGGAWFEHEHQAHGIDFGTGHGQRLDWLHEAVTAIRTVLDGEAASSPPGGRYRFDHLQQLPRPLQPRLPIMIGGSGEKKTLRTVAMYADMWNAMGSTEFLRHKVSVLQEHCAAVGRDITEIELTVGCKPLIRDTEAEARRAWEAQMAHNRTPMSEVADDDTFWIGTPDQIVERMVEARALGFDTFIAEMPAPYDEETLGRWIGQVKPLVERAT
ncbi:MAG: LLM class flavin-dependent oxidoreductase [Chloroflexi bacterium]|nr:MAG: LLM class flavin-dependent oxidoreductase [Chloroflexota bacterium]